LTASEENTMHINELATPWLRKSPPGICSAALVEEEREAAIDRDARVRFLFQSAFYFGIPVSKNDIEKHLVQG
jgi:hypothetical protein